MYYLNHYKIAWDKVQTLDDIKKILQALDLAFEPNCPSLILIKDYVVLQDKPKYSIPL